MSLFQKSRLGLAFASVAISFTGIVIAEPPGLPNEMPKKKLIAAGWDSPSPELLVQHLAEMEKTPFNGVRILLEVQGDQGEKVTTRRMINGSVWKREWFQPTIDQLRKVRSSQLTDNFLGVGPGATIDWFDDAGWEQTINHFRIIAWIAKEGGLKGLFFDPETGTKQPAFSYNRQPGRNEHTFAEYAAQVRKRGRQVMEAMAAEYPEMTIFTTFLAGGQSYSPFYRGGQSHPHHYYFDGKAVLPSGPQGPLEVQEQVAPLERIEGGSYNLLPAFLNGWLDAIPPQMTIVDGLEQTYTTVEEDAFIRWAHAVHQTALPMIVPENRAKYRAQVQAAFGLYLDAYTNPKSSRHYVGPDAEGTESADAPRVERFKKAARNAFTNTDQYVWLWGEKHRWWPTPMERVAPQTWEEVAPGISDALRAALDPGLRSRTALLSAARKLDVGDSLLGERNLILNGDFLTTEGWVREDAENDPPVHTASAGHRQAGALRMEGDGIVLQNVAVDKGKGTFGIRAWVREEGEAKAQLRIRWRKGDGPYFFAHSNNIRLQPDENTRDTNGWMRVQGIVTVPPGLNRLVVQLVTTGPGAVCFDDVEVVSLTEKE